MWSIPIEFLYYPRGNAFLIITLAYVFIITYPTTVMFIGRPSRGTGSVSLIIMLFFTFTIEKNAKLFLASITCCRCRWRRTPMPWMWEDVGQKFGIDLSVGAYAQAEDASACYSSASGLYLRVGSLAVSIEKVKENAKWCATYIVFLSKLNYI